MLPPRPMGAMVDSALVPEEQGFEIPVEGPMEFPGGAEIIPQEDGSALIQARIDDPSFLARGRSSLGVGNDRLRAE